MVTFETENLPPPVEYHSWKLEYHQIYTREITKRSMTKDSYTPTIRSFAYAEERITTQEECCPVLIPANSVHIEKAEIHEAIKVLSKFYRQFNFKIMNISAPTVVRYVRGSDILPSERSGSRTLVNKSSVSQIQFETKAPIPVIGSNQINGSVPTLTLNDRLLNRPTMHVDASIIRRPPRRLIRNVTHENIVRLAVYG